MEQKKPRKDKLAMWIGIILAGGTLLLALLLLQLRGLQALGKPLPVLGQVADFALTNQNGQAVSLGDLRGRPWLADIIFTRCTGPCRAMSRQMQEVQQSLPASSRAKLVSLTTDPDYDNPKILTSYAQLVGADTNRWSFLTGTKKQIAALAVSSLKLTAVEKQPTPAEDPADLFVHSTIFVLVDGHGQLRAVFESGGEGVDLPRTKAQIMAGFRRLEHEP
jgi:protein SCO1/2